MMPALPVDPEFWRGLRDAPAPVNPLGWLWRLLTPMRPFGLFLEGKVWTRLHVGRGGIYERWELTDVDEPSQVGPLRSDPSHYDERGLYLWWGR